MRGGGSAVVEERSAARSKRRGGHRPGRGHEHDRFCREQLDRLWPALEHCLDLVVGEVGEYRVVIDAGHDGAADHGAAHGGDQSLDIRLGSGSAGVVVAEPQLDLDAGEALPADDSYVLGPRLQ